MKELIIVTALGFSITNAIVFLHSFSWLRKIMSGIDDREFHRRANLNELSIRASILGRLFHCHACMGFWVGLATYMVLPIWNFEGNIVYLSPLVNGFWVSGWNFIIWVFLRRHGAEEL